MFKPGVVIQIEPVYVDDHEKYHQITKQGQKHLKSLLDVMMYKKYPFTTYKVEWKKTWGLIANDPKLEARQVRRDVDAVWDEFIASLAQGDLA